MSFFEYITDKQVASKEAIASALQDAGGSEEKALSMLGLSSDTLLNLRGEYYNLPIKSVNEDDISEDILKHIPEESAKYYKFVPIGITDGVLEIGIIDPDNIGARDALQFISTKTGMPFKIFLIAEENFEEIVKSYKNLRGEVTKALSELEKSIKNAEKKAGLHKDGKSARKQTKIVEDAPVTKIVAVILRHAAEGDASDVHIEHMGDKVRVRFRVDGVLYTSILLPPEVHAAVVSRIKILTDLKLDEKRKPQDGRFSARIEGRKIDFRVSTFPSYYGEKVVMRILDPEKGSHTLETVGLSPRNIKIVREALKRPYGIILITGPTGSGKTTTLYSMLGEIDKEKVNVVSLEDPVEYNVPGVSQSQVRPEIDYTFANGLRSILRQDPDVIMVGEIRDKETAQLAIQAALTGHLVFSTLHTNNAIGVVPRLVDMGVDPYLIAPTLILTMAQRLTRTLCPNSKKEIPISDSMRVIIEEQFVGVPEAIKKELLQGKNTVYEAVSTPECPSGTKGRTAVFEMLEMDRDIERVILENPTEQEIEKIARQKGMLTMREDAIIKALNGEIPFEEVYKV